MVADGLDGLLKKAPFMTDWSLNGNIPYICGTNWIFYLSTFLSTYPSIYAFICTLHTGKYVGIYWYWHIPLFMGIVHKAATKKIET